MLFNLYYVKLLCTAQLKTIDIEGRRKKHIPTFCGYGQHPGRKSWQKSRCS